VALRRNIAALHKDNSTINEIVSILKCSNKTVIAVKREMVSDHLDPNQVMNMK
jgi:hypothetical protein